MTIKLPVDQTAFTDYFSDHEIAGRKRYQAGMLQPPPPSYTLSPFPVDQTFSRRPAPRLSHWSIAWSDIMMTMFILFLSLFVYQATNREYLVSEKAEIIGGDTREAIENEKNNSSGFPFMVIKPAAPLVTAGSIKKIEPISLQEINLESTFSADEIAKIFDTETDGNTSATDALDSVAQLPLAAGELGPEKTSVDDIFLHGRHTLDMHNLNTFAALDLVPDKTVRIVLTGDLLFATGQAKLSDDALVSLEKLAAVIQDTEDQIHVEGHTDDIPIFSDRYTNNWELSLARANAVAFFLIDTMQMNPSQFVISGYSSYRSVLPNTSSINRAANRRVEIVITKQPT